MKRWGLLYATALTSTKRGNTYAPVGTVRLIVRSHLSRGIKIYKTPTPCLPPPRQQMESFRREKDEADRRSCAGMALAHADATVELQSHLEAANEATKKLEVSRNGLPYYARRDEPREPRGVTRGSERRRLRQGCT